MTIQPGKTGIKTPVLAVVGVTVVLFAVVAAWFFADRRGDPAYREPDSVSASSVVAGVRASPTTLPGIATIPDDFERNALLYEFIADADRNLIEQHLATMVDLPANPHRGDVVRVLYVRYAALDPVLPVRKTPGAPDLGSILPVVADLRPDVHRWFSGTGLPRRLELRQRRCCSKRGRGSAGRRCTGCGAGRCHGQCGWAGRRARGAAVFRARLVALPRLVGCARTCSGPNRSLRRSSCNVRRSRTSW